MRLVKIFGLAAVAAVAATAFVGTSSASAFHFEAYCSLNEWLCDLTNRIVLVGWWKWRRVGPPLFKGTINEECGDSAAESTEGKKELLDEGGMEVTLESFTFSECKPCTSVKVSTPVKIKIFMMSEEEAEKPNWLVEFKEFNVSFEGCPLGVKCKFGATGFNTILEIAKEEVKLNTNNAELKLIEGNSAFCGKTGQWQNNFRWVWKLDNGMEEVIYPSLFI